ncbi:hypothetical protein ABPG73_008543, partial [Tetrahymena malaccensis]
MEQQNKSFTNLDDFTNSNLNAIASIVLKLKNFDFKNKSIVELNNSLKRCCILESLVLNLEQESISDDQINPFLNSYRELVNQIPNFDLMSNDQKCSSLQNLIKSYNLKELSIEPIRKNQISEVGEFLQRETVFNLINLKSLEINL